FHSRSLPAKTNLLGLGSFATCELRSTEPFDWAPQANWVRFPVSLPGEESRNACDWTRVRRRPRPAADRTLCFPPGALHSLRLGSVAAILNLGPLSAPRDERALSIAGL